MTPTCPPDVTSLLGYFVKFAPVVISLLVAWIAFRQWRLNEEKLRSDMYAKRFSVYENTLRFYYALMWDTDKTPVEELISVQVKFLTSWRESAFLFSKDVGVFDTLDAFRKATNPLMNHKKGHASAVDFDPEAMEVHLKALEAKLWPYIDMSKVGVPTPSCFPR